MKSFVGLLIVSELFSNVIFLLIFRINEEEDLNLGTSFSAETNRRDEDADM